MKSFEYTVDIPVDDDSDEVESVTLLLKPFKRVPVAIYRQNRGDQEAQMWATVEWGLSADQLKALDRLPMTDIMDLFNAWGESAELDEDKPVRPPKAKNPE